MVVVNGAVWALTQNNTSVQATSSALSADQWYYVTAVFASSVDRKIYVNGSLAGSNTESKIPDTGFIERTRIGQRANSINDQNFDGTIDDVRIYNRALSAAEIAALAAGNHTTAVWDGSNSTNWETAANWDTSAVPDPFTRIIVNNSGSGSPILSASVSGASLTIEASSSLDLAGFDFEFTDSGTLKGGGTLKLRGDETISNLTNLGTTSTGTVLYYGTGSFTGLAAGDNYNNLTINDGLVGYWTFDEGTGTAAADSSGHGNNGTLTNGPTWSADPTNNINFNNPYALSFDGTDDYVGGDTLPTSQIANVTLAGWAFIPSLSEGGVMIHVGNPASSTNGFGFGVGDTSVDTNGNNLVGLISGIAWMNFNKSIGTGWHHLSMTRDDTTWRGYVDGIVSATTFTNTPNTPTGGFSIGKEAVNVSGRNFNGSIDDVRIYNRALSAAEIAALAAGNQPSTTRGTFTLDAALDVNGDLVLNGGTLDISSSNYGVTVGGSWENNGGVFTPRKGTVTLDGTTSGLQILSGGQQFNALTLDGNAGTYTLADHLTASGTLALTNGTLDASSTGNFTVRAGTINQTSGFFTSRLGTVILTSSADATATITSSLNELRIEDSSESGLVGYWKFDEGTNSGSILDSSGYGNTGVRRGGAGRIWSGSSLPSLQFENRYAMQFDGTDDYVDAPSANALLEGGMQYLTLSLWIKGDVISGRNGGLISKAYTQAVSAMYLIHNNVSKLVWTLGSGLSITSNTSLSAGTWYHVTATWDGVSGNGYIYLNGNEDGTGTWQGTWTSNVNDNIAIGSQWDLSNIMFDGLIDDVRIYGRALSANEVANLARGRYASGNSSTSTFTLGANLSTTSLALDSGNISTSNRTLTVTNAIQLLRGGGNLTLGSALATLNDGLVLSGSTITGGAGTLDVNGAVQILTGSLIAPSGTMSVSGDWTVSGGTFTGNGGTVSFDGTGLQTLTSGGQALAGLTIAKSANTLTLATDDLTVSGAFTLTTGTFSQGLYNLTVSGGMTLASGTTFTRSSDTAKKLILAGDLTLTDNTASKQNLGYLQIGTSPDTTDLATDIVAWKIDVGTGDVLNTNGYDLTIGTGGLTMFGTLDATDDSAGDDTAISLSGNWTTKSTGTFTHGTGTVTLNGTNQTLSGSTTFYNLTKSIVSADTLSFAATATQTIAGTLTLKGVGGNPLKLRSSQTGSYAYLTVLAGTSPVLQYLNVRDSNASGGQTLVCDTTLGCVNAGGNVNWSFPVPATGDGGPSTWLLNLRRENNLSLSGQPSGGSSGGASSSESGITSFVPDYGPLEQAMKDAQERARETADSAILDPRRIPAIRDALIARFNAQMSGADRREAEPHFAPAGASRGEPHYPEGATRGEEGTASGTSLSRIAKRRGLLSAIVNGEEVLYRDVDIYAWYAPYISLLIEENVAQGYKDEDGKPTGEFGTANPVTREEVLKMALEAVKTDLTGAASPRNRTAQGRWSAAYVALAEAMELSVFRPTINVLKPATRGEVIQTILEVMGITIGTKARLPYSDVPLDHPYALAIDAATYFGIVEGDSDKNGNPTNTFRPDESINRAEAAKIIALVQELMR